MQPRKKSRSGCVFSRFPRTAQPQSNQTLKTEEAKAREVQRERQNEKKRKKSEVGYGLVKEGLPRRGNAGAMYKFMSLIWDGMSCSLSFRTPSYFEKRD
jgi:hypothetical protein